MKVKYKNQSDDQTKVAVVWFDHIDREYIVKFFKDGEYQEDADYFTDTILDAIGTANHYLDFAI